ncbi:hypothetical protein EDM53_05790 [Rickettsiales endosymbiont of Peranema trichophorum]|uniref:hypothetical protein n=1 Tax=Rickettsiales endosymbiont of Peranema trichophorum TaxID=2486577 RepID=UPI001022E32E|nr:hypothetical protein [Rickettsiales endosymbiont of Peranema trichophorum]RZI45145.1 hypothetical protein EDM53_05790 [Rickettsiales endosymbiont of Peranema trichophorum]
MEHNKITSKPPSKEILERDAFIKAANQLPKERVASDSIITNGALPWNLEYCRDDVKKAFTVSLPEKYIIKLQYIKEVTNQSQQKIARNAICEAVDKIISDLLSKTK